MLLMGCVEATMLSQVHTDSRRSRLSWDIQDIPSWYLGKAHWRAPARVSVRRNTRNSGLAEYSRYISNPPKKTMVKGCPMVLMP